MALAVSELPKKFWSFAFLDAIDKANLFPPNTQTAFFRSPNKTMPGMRTKAVSFLPFGQGGYVVDTSPTKRELEGRTLKARYLRSTQEGQYVLLFTAVEKSA